MYGKLKLYVIPIHLLIWSFFLYQCASPGSIQGGPKDENPPLVDTTASSPNPALNFQEKRIKIVFTEWVELDDPYQQIFISPPLSERPEYRLKGKSLIIDFHEEEELNENTTYIVNLGKSIVDITEKNALPDYQYVFSTGGFLDSLSFQGVVRDKITGDPVENISLLLFDNLSDTAITTVDPSYFARTNKEGEYHFQYLRPGQFQMIGFLDENQDFKYDIETEIFGYHDSIIDTRAQHLSHIPLEVSLGRPPVYLDKVDTSLQGLVSLTYTDAVEDTAMVHLDVSHSTTIERKDKTINLWYHPDQLPLQIISTNSSNLADTLIIQQSNKKLPTVEEITLKKESDIQLPNKPLTVLSSWPLETLQMDRILVTKNNAEKTLSLDSFQVDFNTLRLYYPWKADTSYQVQFLPNALQFSDEIEHDTLSIKLKPVAPDNLSAVEIVFLADSTQRKSHQWIVELMQKDKRIRKMVIKDLDQKVVFSALKPGEYSIQLTRDDNKNSIWDAARYYEKKQAEEIMRIDLGTLRANWIQEKEINIP